jgi:hypothetical protein
MTIGIVAVIPSQSEESFSRPIYDELKIKLGRL